MDTAQTWTVTVLGTRGAAPMAAPDYMEYGGNTSCVAVEWPGGLAVLDAGSGLLHLNAARARRVHILLSHLHLDHILGLPGLSLLHDPQAEVHLYGQAQEGPGLRAYLERVFGPPYWPLGLGEVQASLTVHELTPGVPFCLEGGLNVATLPSCHPDQSLIYRLDGAGRSLVYTPDCELTREMVLPLTDFARDCGLLIWDANYTEADLRRGWGHSTWEQGLSLAQAAGAARVLMTHYDRSYTDSFLQAQERLARQKSSACIFAREGMVIAL